MYDYIKSPEKITADSFRRIREQTDLSNIAEEYHSLAIRLVHTSGNVDIVNHLRVVGNILAESTKALNSNVNILCDVEMVKQGISNKFCSIEPQCFLNRPDISMGAKNCDETRSMYALKYWKELLPGSIVVIGNAPTALFRCLEMLQESAAQPALIIGMPVGFVGANESKEALLEYARRYDVAAVSLIGRVGGSALAATTLNALALSSLKNVSYDGY